MKEESLHYKDQTLKLINQLYSKIQNKFLIDQNDIELVLNQNQNILKFFTFEIENISNSEEITFLSLIIKCIINSNENFSKDQIKNVLQIVNNIFEILIPKLLFYTEKNNYDLQKENLIKKIILLLLDVEKYHFERYKIIRKMILKNEFLYLEEGFHQIGNIKNSVVLSNIGFEIKKKIIINDVKIEDIFGLEFDILELIFEIIHKNSISFNFLKSIKIFLDLIIDFFKHKSESIKEKKFFFLNKLNNFFLKNKFNFLQSFYKYSIHQESFENFLDVMISIIKIIKINYKFSSESNFENCKFEITKMNSFVQQNLNFLDYFENKSEVFYIVSKNEIFNEIEILISFENFMNKWMNISNFVEYFKQITYFESNPNKSEKYYIIIASYVTIETLKHINQNQIINTDYFLNKFYKEFKILKNLSKNFNFFALFFKPLQNFNQINIIFVKIFLLTLHEFHFDILDSLVDQMNNFPINTIELYPFIFYNYSIISAYKKKLAFNQLITHFKQSNEITNVLNESLKFIVFEDQTFNQEYISDFKILFKMEYIIQNRNLFFLIHFLIK